MARTLDEVREYALELPDEDRSSLVDELIESLRDDEDRAFDQKHLPEWERRYEEWESGAVEGVPLEDVIRRLNAKYGGGHSS